MNKLSKAILLTCLAILLACLAVALAFAVIALAGMFVKAFMTTMFGMLFVLLVVTIYRILE